MTHLRGDRLLAVDVEMTCWDGDPPAGESAEIIEIGVVEIDAVALVVRRSASLLVRPVRSAVSEFCTRLTGITPAEVHSGGRRLPEVADDLRKTWGAGGKAWVTWGRDVEAIRRDFSLYRDRGHPDGVTVPFSASLVDLGAMFSLLSGHTEFVGLAEACRILGLADDWRRHRAEPDARAVARVWCELARRHRLALPPA